MAPPAAALQQGPDAWSRAEMAAAVAVGLVLYLLPLAFPVPLLDPDEGLHAAIAQGMVERGEWLTPRFLGEPFPDKPILFFWAQALSLRLLGFSEAAVRLPGLLLGALGAVATGLLAREWFGARIGWLAGLCYATMLLPVGVAQAAVHDIALVPWVALALRAFAQAAREPRAGRSLALAASAGGWLGLAVLTKGLTGVAIVGLAHALTLLAGRRLRMLDVAGGVVALALAAAIASPWYLWMDAASPGYLRYFFLDRHLLGFATTTQIHGQRPWWYYLPILACGGLPWIAHVLADLSARRRGGAPGDRAAWHAEGCRFALLWLGSALVFLSVAGSKLVTYLLPALPAVALLAGVAWGRWLHDGKGEPSDRRVGLAALGLASGALAVALPGALVASSAATGIEAGGFAWAGAVALAVAWQAPWAAWSRGLRGSAYWLTAALVAATTLFGLAIVMPRLAPSLSAKALSAELNRRGRFPERLWVFDERIGSLLFYLDPPLRRDLTPSRVENVTSDRLLSMRQPPPGVVIAVRAERLAWLARRVDLSATPFTPAGRYRVYTAEAFHAAVAQATRRR